MMLVDRLRKPWWGREGRGSEGWKDTCEAGAPVPADDGCSHLDCASVRLTALGRGGRGAVSCLERPGSPESAKLAAMGILPGVRLRVVQRSPSWVLKVGRTEIALDSELAGRIRVVSDLTHARGRS